eukprot:CAMPEP_0116034274 /NCGR_PEP_ID=MMETSP0321-20121206/19505_1 /TAXON_ID=163516 /ORGANISM="Leptocylindrus danicus var. danicus, Strain B650" /LENGTH=324 /DNA_ID=CAMNT_0003510545 /DNA_START=13 /DNA_END=987 /DNA_ORIENTATION=+
MSVEPLTNAHGRGHNETGLTPAWMARFGELRKFKEEHGHANVPCKFHSNPDDEHAQLGRWISKQRYQYKLYTGELSSVNTKCRMTPEKIKLMESVGFQWATGTSRGKNASASDGRPGQPQQGQLITPWKVRYAELIAYKNQFGDTLVPYKYPPNIQLGRWVSVQRYMYNELKKGKKSSMTPERIEMLDLIGFVWDASDRSSETVATAESNKSFVKSLREGGSGVVGSPSAPSNGKAVTNARRISSSRDARKRKTVFRDGPINIEGMEPYESIYDRFILKLSPPKHEVTANDSLADDASPSLHLKRESDPEVCIFTGKKRALQWV